MLLNELSHELAVILDKISSIASSCGLYQIEGKCEFVRKELDEPLKVAIVGITSSGKSTLLNALVRRQLVPTGAETVSYNVNILRHKSKSPTKKELVIAHLKNNKGCVTLPITTLNHLVDGRDDSYKDLRKRVSWVEAFVDFDYLRDIDLIDTPGLLSTKEEDSANTIELFKDEMRRPDVIVYLMQRAIEKEDIAAANSFQRVMSNGNTSIINGLNTIAALTHCDYYCKNNYSLNFHDLGNAIIENNRANYADFRLCFSKTFTIAAIYAQSAYCLTDDDFAIIKAISDSVVLNEFIDLYTKNDFINDQEHFERFIKDKDEREQFLSRVDIEVVKYSAWWLRRNNNSSIKALKEHLISYSGVQEMDRYIFSNFKRLAMFFKTMKLISGIRKSTEALSTSYSFDCQREGINTVSILCKDFEVKLHRSFSYLSVLMDYYSKKTYFTEEEWNEAVKTIELCLSDSYSQSLLISQLQYWDNKRKTYSLLADVVAEGSCIKLINQVKQLLI